MPWQSHDHNDVPLDDCSNELNGDDDPQGKFPFFFFLCSENGVALARDCLPFECRSATKSSVVGAKFALGVLVTGPLLSSLTIEVSRLPADVVYVFAGECVVL